ncbi:hypothetical protein RCCWILLIS_52 [Rhodobacter phage RcCWillis]|nr:hypothetical protein RCCWILLIS_52 [Rhodobacter phage RcCWillis]
MKNVAVSVLAIAAVASAAAAGVYAYRNNRLAAELSAVELRLSVAESNLAVQERALEQAREARAVLEAHYDRVAADAAYWRQLASDLSSMEGANEDLNPYERAVLDSLRGR